MMNPPFWSHERICKYMHTHLPRIKVAFGRRLIALRKTECCRLQIELSNYQTIQLLILSLVLSILIYKSFQNWIGPPANLLEELNTIRKNPNKSSIWQDIRMLQSLRLSPCGTSTMQLRGQAALPIEDQQFFVRDWDQHLMFTHP
jgi:hypothetical protein